MSVLDLKEKFCLKKKKLFSPFVMLSLSTVSSQLSVIIVSSKESDTMMIQLCL